MYPDATTQPKVLGPAGFFDKQWFNTFLEKSGQDVVDGLTHHIYNLGPGLSYLLYFSLKIFRNLIGFWLKKILCYLQEMILNLLTGFRIRITWIRLLRHTKIFPRLSRNLGRGQELGWGKLVELSTVVANMCHIPLLTASGKNHFAYKPLYTCIYLHIVKWYFIEIGSWTNWAWHQLSITRFSVDKLWLVETMLSLILQHSFLILIIMGNYLAGCFSGSTSLSY